MSEEKTLNIKETILLPKTDFELRAGLVKREPEMQKHWDETDLYGRIREAREGAERYILHDGPPYANGDVHIGTALNKILKDIVVRYQTMQGKDAPYVPGWDCHGLPIEHKVMVDLGDKARKVPKRVIRKLCLEMAEKFIDIQRRQFKRLGVMGEWMKPYLTIDPGYEADILGVFEDLVRSGYVYRKLRPIHWCMSCETALAEAELEYADETGPSIYVHFELENPGDAFDALPDGEKASIMIWTTTPWTLPANVATALHPELEYSLVKLENEAGTRYTVFCSQLVERVAALTDATATVLETKSGAELEGLTYRHPFLDRQGKVVLADYVAVEDGTGCVHTAPGHGAEDYETGLKYDLPVLSPVKADGAFTAEAGPYEGQKVLEANKQINADLNESGAMYFETKNAHRYPHCWRCKQPVIFRATEQWFIAVDHNDARGNALKAVGETRWVPEWGEKRISAMVENRPDWCISRQRAWGVPIPAFYCTGCGDSYLTADTVAAVREVFEKEGANSWFEQDAAHFLPDGTACPNCSGTEFKQEEDIFDVWFESGASHRAVCQRRPEVDFPADLYLEGTDQHRGWFQVSLLPSVMIHGHAPFRTVLTHGFVVDENGEKVSKSKGTLLMGEAIANEVGADIMRLWIGGVNFTDEIPATMDVIKGRADAYKKIRFTFRYLLGNLAGFDPEHHGVDFAELQELDRWALHRLHEVEENVRGYYENYEFHRVLQELLHFVIVDLSSFYLDVQKDTLYTFGENWPERRSAQTALNHLLNALTRMFAPIMVHTMEEVWGHLPGEQDVNSVHLALWPDLPTTWRDDELGERYAKLLEVRSAVNLAVEALRESKTVKKVQEASLNVSPTSEDIATFLSSFGEDRLVNLLQASNVTLGSVTEGEGLVTVDAGKSEHAKCERCWNHRETVGRSETFPNLCDRCERAVSE